MTKTRSLQPRPAPSERFTALISEYRRILGAHGGEGIERMLLGSVAVRIVRGESQPLLVVPARKNRE
jgi:hypothetical protein